MISLSKIKAAGFTLELDGYDLVVEPFSKLKPPRNIGNVGNIVSIKNIPEKKIQSNSAAFLGSDRGRI